MPDDPAWRRAELSRLAAGLALAAVFGWVLVRAWPEPREPGLPRPEDRFYVASDAPFAARMAAEDAGRSVVANADVEQYRVLFESLSARCGAETPEELAAAVDSTHNAVRGKTGSFKYSRTMAEMGFAVELAGDRDCLAAARSVADGYEEVIYDSKPATEWRASEHSPAP
jgi:hypothetical protein